MSRAQEKRLADNLRFLETLHVYITYGKYKLTWMDSEDKAVFADISKKTADALMEAGMGFEG